MAKQKVIRWKVSSNFLPVKFHQTYQATFLARYWILLAVCSDSFFKVRRSNRNRILKFRPFLKYFDCSPFLNSMQRNKARASTQSKFRFNGVLPTDSITCSILIWSSRLTLIITSSFGISVSATTSHLISGFHSFVI